MFQTGESGTIKERGECQGSVYISHSSCLYFKWEGCEEIWRADVVQGDAHKQERQDGFSDNYKAILGGQTCWQKCPWKYSAGCVENCTEHLELFLMAGTQLAEWPGIKFLYQVPAAPVFVCSPGRTLAGWISLPAAPTPAALWALTAGAVSVCLRARLKTQCRSGKGKLISNSAFRTLTLKAEHYKEGLMENRGEIKEEQ